MTDKNPPTDGTAIEESQRRVHTVKDPLETMDVASELDALMRDLNALDLNDGERRPGDAPVVQLDDNLDVVDEAPAPVSSPRQAPTASASGRPFSGGAPTEPHSAGARGPLDASTLSSSHLTRPPQAASLDVDDALTEDVSDDAFLKELGFATEAPTTRPSPGPTGPPSARGESMAEATATRLQGELDRLAADSSARIAELEAELDQLHTKYRKAAADFDKMRKRMHREKTESIQFANDKLVKDLLPVMDNLELALDHSDSTEFEQFVTGVKMVHRLMTQQLSKYGLKPFDSKGKPFDPREHEAMATLPSDEVDPGCVLSEAQRGYRLFDRLLRPALVTVAMAPPTARPPAVPTPVDETDEAEIAEDPEVEPLTAADADVAEASEESVEAPDELEDELEMDLTDVLVDADDPAAPAEPVAAEMDDEEDFDFGDPEPSLSVETAESESGSGAPPNAA